jgi:hypothetical protein
MGAMAQMSWSGWWARQGSNLRPLGCKRGEQHRTMPLPAITLPEDVAVVALSHPVRRRVAPRMVPRLAGRRAPPGQRLRVLGPASAVPPAFYACSVVGVPARGRTRRGWHRRSGHWWSCGCNRPDGCGVRVALGVVASAIVQGELVATGPAVRSEGTGRRRYPASHDCRGGLAHLAAELRSAAVRAALACVAACSYSTDQRSGLLVRDVPRAVGSIRPQAVLPPAARSPFADLRPRRHRLS